MSETTAGRLSVLTLNIWNYEGPWEARLPLIRACIAELDPDLIALQEVLVGPTIDQTAAIFDGTPYATSYARAQDFWLDTTLGFGNLVASRWPLAQTDAAALPQRPGIAPRVALTAVVDAPVGPVSFTSTHLTYPVYDGYYRELQAKAVAERARVHAAGSTFPAIVCGDFNAVPDAAEIRFMRGLQSVEATSTFFHDAFELAGQGSGATVTRDNPYVQNLQKDLRLDYIFVGPSTTGAGRVLACRVVADRPVNDVYPSDHFGVYAELALA